MAEDNPSTSKGYKDNHTFLAAVAAYYNQKLDYTTAYERLMNDNTFKEENTPGFSKTTATATSSNMPSHPKDNANSGDASTKPQDQGSGTASAGNQETRKATIEEHKANPGPVMAKNLPEPKSKEQLKKEAEQLNK